MSNYAGELTFGSKSGSVSLVPTEFDRKGKGFLPYSSGVCRKWFASASVSAWIRNWQPLAKYSAYEVQGLFLKQLL